MLRATVLALSLGRARRQGRGARRPLHLSGALVGRAAKGLALSGKRWRTFVALGCRVKGGNGLLASGNINRVGWLLDGEFPPPRKGWVIFLHP